MKASRKPTPLLLEQTGCPDLMVVEINGKDVEIRNKSLDLLTAIALAYTIATGIVVNNAARFLRKVRFDKFVLAERTGFVEVHIA